MSTRSNEQCVCFDISQEPKLRYQPFPESLQRWQMSLRQTLEVVQRFNWITHTHRNRDTHILVLLHLWGPNIDSMYSRVHYPNFKHHTTLMKPSLNSPSCAVWPHKYSKLPVIFVNIHTQFQSLYSRHMKNALKKKKRQSVWQNHLQQCRLSCLRLHTNTSHVAFYSDWGEENLNTVSSASSWVSM